jgi:BirA family biotin operon repressor/biotin-[acetyl-CoA-carboxylase] ligase
MRTNDTRLALLDALAKGPATGPELADRLDVSRAAVWKQVEALREEGFSIPGEDGYRLESVPETGATALQWGLEGFTVEYHDSLDSTNRRARELAERGETDVVVVAGEQTAGRGRLDRDWASPPGGVYLSAVCRPAVPPARTPVFTLAAAVATARAAREAGVDARIKWPNDVVVPAGDGGEGPERERGYRKLAGVLTEMQGEQGAVEWLVVGVGVNVADPGIEGATGLGADADRRAFVQTLLGAFDSLRGDPDAVLPAWRELALTLGQRVRVETPGGAVEGEAVDVEEPGALLVDTGDGIQRVTAGDCEHLRPA